LPGERFGGEHYGRVDAGEVVREAWEWMSSKNSLMRFLTGWKNKASLIGRPVMGSRVLGTPGFILAQEA